MTLARSGGHNLPALYRQALERLRRSARLRRSLLAWLTIGCVTSIGGSTGVAVLNGSGLALAVIGGVIWWLFVAVAMVGGAALLHTPEGNDIDLYGIPNGLSLIRAWACLPLLLPHRLGFILWCSVGGCVAMLDFVDGYIARRVGPVTELGKAIDPAGDALLFSMGALGNVVLGIVPWWMATIIFIRFGAPLLLTPLVLAVGKRPELVHTTWGRRNTAAIGLVYFVGMWVRIGDGPVDVVAAVVGLPLVVPTGLLHFAALWARVRDAPRVGQ